MYISIILLFIIIGIIQYKLYRKKVEQHIKEDYLLKNKEELQKQLQTEKQFVEDELLLQSQRLAQERQRFDDALKKNLDDIAWLDKKKEIAEEAFNKRILEQEKAIQVNKEKQLCAVEEVVSERKARVDTDINAYRDVEMQKARTAIQSQTSAEEKWAEEALSTYWDSLARETYEREQELTTVMAMLDDYKKKQQVVNEAILRQRAIDEQQDFYRVCLSQDTIEDVQILQSVRQKLHFSESLNKLIYDVYISKPAKEMIKRVLGTSDPSGVYKITRLKTGEVYIGQAVHLSDRWQQHLKTVYGAGTIARSMLHTTMQKDGVENFTFEMVEEVPKEKLREREKYWIDFYQSKSYGMNERNG